MTLETTPWDVTDGMTTERARIGLLFACLEDDPHDDAFFAEAVEAVQRSRMRYGTAQGHAMTPKRVAKLMAAYPTVSSPAVSRIVEALGYDFDIGALELGALEPGAPEAASRPGSRVRAAAKRTRSANRTQRRKS